MKIKKTIQSILDISDRNLRKMIFVFIALELIVVFFVTQEVLAMDYTYEGTANRTILKACIGFQILMIFMIAQYQNGIEKSRLLKGQLLL